jgi:C4-dicarboxylate-specific signal transduction histidine kinase
MMDNDDRFLREKNLAFFGAVTASLSHEINNVFTIINELSGLLDDYMYAAQQGRALDPEKLKRTCEKISAQIERGKTIVKRLNTFAHSTDKGVAKVNLREQLERITAICQRLAAMKKAGIETGFPEEDVELSTNPFVLQQAVFSCIQMALAAAGEQRFITVRYEKPESGALIFVESADPIARTEETEAEMSVLSLIMKELGGTIDGAPGPDGGFCFKLVLPAAITDSSV